MWLVWLNSTLDQSGTRIRPSLQEERILQLASWIAEETDAARPAKEASLIPDIQKAR